MTDNFAFLRQMIYEFYKSWNKFDQKEKIKFLQLFEHVNSKAQGRMEREVVFKELLERDSTQGSYMIFQPNYIYCHKLPNLPEDNLQKYKQITPIETIYHEAKHAHVHDAIINKAPWETFLSKVNNKKIDDSFTKRDTLAHWAIANTKNNTDEVIYYFAFYKLYEEQLVRKETLLFLTHTLLKLTKECKDFELFFNEFLIHVLHYNTYAQELNNPPYTNEEYIKAFNDVLATENKMKYFFPNYEITFNLKHIDSDRIEPRSQQEQEEAKTEYQGIDTSVSKELINKSLQTIKNIHISMAAIRIRQLFKEATEKTI